MKTSTSELAYDDIFTILKTFSLLNFLSVIAFIRYSAYKLKSSTISSLPVFLTNLILH